MSGRSGVAGSWGSPAHCSSQDMVDAGARSGRAGHYSLWSSLEFHPPINLSTESGRGVMPRACPRLKISSHRSTLTVGPPATRPYCRALSRCNNASAASTASCHSSEVVGIIGGQIWRFTFGFILHSTFTPKLRNLSKASKRLLGSVDNSRHLRMSAIAFCLSFFSL
jgi:hypothetical protein